ncbi:MAG: SUMF1/EgtB/PvdO family nonheme iron enzyme [Planctomycetaceae bacterium]|jgi:formylglycine-generating enzyme required for sulfatase activity|nr:SUMF1/EgtB/PvdO family nonheme iron enzyme [Planctomycetaceae bacterium]
MKFGRVFILTVFPICLLCPFLYAYDNGVVPVNTKESAKRLVNDLMQTHGEKYPKGKEFLDRLANVNNQTELDGLIREAALANPLLDFDKILCIRRKPRNGQKGFISLNAYTEDTIPRKGWDNEIVMLSGLRTTPELTTVYRHNNDGILRDMELSFDKNKILFASVNDKGNWAVFEWDIVEWSVEGKPTTAAELTPQVDGVQWFDPCYLAEDGAILTFSTAGMQGVPCVAGSQKVASLFRIDKKGVRQLTFEQDSGWHPRLLNDGRVMYLRWQYTETPHYFDRMLFTMTPDGRQQRALWGSGAFFPTAFKFARPVLTHPSMVLGIVSGHHSLPEQGRLMLVDPNLATHYPFRYDAKTKEWGQPGTHADLYPQVYPKEKTGCVQEIPGWGRNVTGNVYDNQGGNCKYTFTTPYPLNEKYFLVSMQINHQGQYGLYLADVFDNLVKLYDLPDAGLYEPVPFVDRKRPPVIADTTDKSGESTVFITDIYEGRGLPDIPRGKAKSLRVFSYHWAYWNTGNYTAMGEHSGYDIKRILGTVPIEEDGSVSFKVPANTPLAFHVLDEDGAALQLMRSWTVAMPGEAVSCTGCHELSHSATPPKQTAASRKPPRDMIPFYGQARPFGFETEIQPVLDKHCVKCHHDENKKMLNLLSFQQDKRGLDWRQNTSYASLHPFLRRNGTEGDIATLNPMEFHASTSELFQRLNRGHYGVVLDKESKDKLYTWLDLNVPYRGAWQSPKNESRRLELQKLYAGLDTNPETEYSTALNAVPKTPVEFVKPDAMKKFIKNAPDNDTQRKYFGAALHPLMPVQGGPIRANGFPFSWQEAKERQAKCVQNTKSHPDSIVLDIPIGKAAPEDDPFGTQTISIRFIKIPAGEFVMGSVDGFDDERPRSVVKIEQPFYIAETEITNRQYAQFDPEHDTGYENEHGYDHISPGYIANHPDQPAARVSWLEAMAFCNWLSKQPALESGKKAMLPTEAQWEWAARAGTETAFYFGHRFADWSYYANLAGAELRKTRTQWNSGDTFDGIDQRRPPLFAAQKGSSVIKHRRYFPEDSLFPLRDDRFSDKWFTVDYVKQYEPNAWGLYDVIGNVWEWTYSDYAPYPYKDDDGRNGGDLTRKKVVRGGSHADRPKVIGSAVRLPYEPYQKVYNAGFRPVIIGETIRKP